MSVFHFSLLPDLYAVVRFDANAQLPDGLFAASGFVSITRTADELSIVCAESAAPAGASAERDWIAIKLRGPFAFEQVGVLAGFTAPLARAGVSVFAISTFDTDYVLIRAAQRQAALDALRSAGHIHVETPA